jgi:hypothetical protein
MPLKSQTFHPAESADAVRHFHVRSTRATELVYAPYLYLEARIDFADVRSGVRQTCSLSNAMEILSMDGDVIWTQDMMMDVDSKSICPGLPEDGRRCNFPEMVDAAFLARIETQFFQYLLRYYSLRMSRNSALNLYSTPNESRLEFTQRCRETMSGSFRRELDGLAELFERKLEQIKEKYSTEHASDDFEQMRLESQAQDVLHRVSERLADLFLGAEFSLDTVSGVAGSQLLGGVEIEERLIALEQEARRAIGNLLGSYQEKVRSIDEYVVHPTLKDIHLVRSCILWMPSEERRS